MGAWLSGRALPSHGRGHRFKSCSAHNKDIFKESVRSAPVAQGIRAFASEAKGRRFESCQVRKVALMTKL